MLATIVAVYGASCFSFPLLRRRAVSTNVMEAPRIARVDMPASLMEVEEPLALEAARNYRAVELQVPSWVSPKPIMTSFIAANSGTGMAKRPPPLVLLHGFDSSALEFRRLLPLLSDAGVEVYFVDLLGWGFGGKEDVANFSPEAKRQHLLAFWSQHLQSRPMVLGGASLGGGIAMDFAVEHPEAVDKLILINPQGFIDGAPKVGPLGPLGIKVLGSWPLRWMANQMAYFDKPRYATDDAVRVGRLHVDTDGWEEASLDYLNSGGYTLSPLVSQVQAPTLMIWGEEDEILDVKEQVPRFQEELRCPVQLQWIEDSGHVPHLEKPTETAVAIQAFLKSKA